MQKLFQTSILWILGIGIGFAQTYLPFFEQSAFDFYRTEILKINPTDKKITVYKYYMDFQNSNRYFSTGECLKKPVFKNDVNELEKDIYGQDNIDSDKFELDLSDINKKQFRTRKNGKGKFPKLYLSYPRVGDSNRYFVNVYEVYENVGNNYHVELNADGIVIDWCKSVHKTIIIH